MPDPLDVDRYLESLTVKFAVHYANSVGSLLLSTAHDNRPQMAKDRARLEDVVRETMGIAEVLGASVMLRESARVVERLRGFRWGAPRFLFRGEELLADVTFREALEDMVTRAPTTLANAAERTAQRISELYSEGRVVAFAKSAEAAVTERVQALLAQAVRQGIPEADAGRLIRMSVDQVRRETEAWTESYSRMAFRTNVNTAVTAGRFRQSRDPDVRAVIPAFRFDSVGDADTRDNHDAADGLIFKVDNLVWNRIAPPLGYNCRCQVSLVSLPMLRRMGRVTADGDIREDRLPPGAFPDPGFRHTGRPDLFMVGT